MRVLDAVLGMGLVLAAACGGAAAGGTGAQGPAGTPQGATVATPDNGGETPPASTTTSTTTPATTGTVPTGHLDMKAPVASGMVADLAVGRPVRGPLRMGGADDLFPSYVRVVDEGAHRLRVGAAERPRAPPRRRRAPLLFRLLSRAHHDEPLAPHCLAHDDMGLKEDVFLSHAGNRRDDSRVGGVID